MRVLLSGGGTGGHITPILAVVDQLKQRKPDAECFYLGEAGAIEPYLAENEPVPFTTYNIQAGKWRRYTTYGIFDYLRDLKTFWLNLRDFFRLIVGIAQSLYYMGRIQPDVVFIKGGYVGLPVGIAAWLWRKPVIIHESDSRPGLANRILARFARSIAVSFPKRYYPNWHQDKLSFTGIPLRQQLFQHPKRQEAQRQLGLDSSRPVLLAMGGSLGARVINQAVVDNLDQLCENWQVLHLCGSKHYQDLSSKIEDYPDCYHLKAFTNQIATYFMACDVVITRGGANALAELAAFGLPAIVVPASQLSDQTKNARIYAESGAAVVAEEQNLGQKLPDLLSDMTPEKQASLGRAIKQFDHLEAAEKVVDLVVKQSRGQ